MVIRTSPLYAMAVLQVLVIVMVLIARVSRVDGLKIFENSYSKSHKLFFHQTAGFGPQNDNVSAPLVCGTVHQHVAVMSTFIFMWAHIYIVCLIVILCHIYVDINVPFEWM